MGRNLFHGESREKGPMIEADRRRRRRHHQLAGDNFHGRIFSMFDVEEIYANNNFSNENKNNSFDFLDDNYEENGHDKAPEPAEHQVYWELQQSLLQELLEHYNSTGAKLRKEIRRQVERAKESHFCDCVEPKVDGCVKCLRLRIVHQLCTKGFNATLCTSIWKHTHKIPGGMHEYIEVMANTQGRKKQIPFLIELDLRGEFKMAKACDEYCRLVNELPEIYIGKADHLNAIVRLVCDAAKKSTMEKKIHMGPWRKISFMQMKWSASNKKKSHQSADENGISSPKRGNADTVPFSYATAVRVA